MLRWKLMVLLSMCQAKRADCLETVCMANHLLVYCVYIASTLRLYSAKLPTMLRWKFCDVAFDMCPVPSWHYKERAELIWRCTRVCALGAGGAMACSCHTLVGPSGPGVQYAKSCFHWSIREQSLTPIHQKLAPLQLAILLGWHGSPNMKLLAHHTAPKQSTSRRPAAFYSSAQWAADGTTIFAASSDNAISAFVLPADLLQFGDDARTLPPQGVTHLPEPTQTFAASPYFSLAEPATQTFLAGCKDHPLHLYAAFPETPQPTPVGTYKLVRKETEEYITPSSLIWLAPGTHFVCGSANRIDYFDLSRHGSDGPVLTVPTIPSKRHISKGNGIGMKGTVAALAVSAPNAHGSSLLAAGTWTRWMGLYDLHRSEGVVANWMLSRSDIPDVKGSYDGQGIVQCVWSPCGKYLVVNERHADSLLVYDIRGSGRLLSVLQGRNSSSQQRLHLDVFQDPQTEGNGFEVWAGSEDGSVQVWDGVGMAAGEVDPSWQWEAGRAPIGAVGLHSSGSVAATCAGGWGYAPMDDTESIPSVPGHETLPESLSLALWEVSPAGDQEE